MSNTSRRNDAKNGLITGYIGFLLTGGVCIRARSEHDDLRGRKQLADTHLYTFGDGDTDLYKMLPKWHFIAMLTCDLGWPQNSSWYGMIQSKYIQQFHASYAAAAVCSATAFPSEAGIISSSFMGPAGQGLPIASWTLIIWFLGPGTQPRRCQ